MLGCGPGSKRTPGVTVRDSAGITLTTISSQPESLPRWSLDPTAQGTIRRPGDAELERLRYGAARAEELTNELFRADLLPSTRPPIGRTIREDTTADGS